MALLIEFHSIFHNAFNLDIIMWKIFTSCILENKMKQKYLQQKCIHFVTRGRSIQVLKLAPTFGVENSLFS